MCVSNGCSVTMGMCKRIRQIMLPTLTNTQSKWLRSKCAWIFGELGENREPYDEVQIAGRC